MGAGSDRGEHVSFDVLVKGRLRKRQRKGEKNVKERGRFSQSANNAEATIAIAIVPRKTALEGIW